MTWFGMDALIMLILFIVFIPISALLLWASTMIFKLREHSFKTAFQVALFVGVINLITSWVTLNTLSLILSSAITYTVIIIAGMFVVKQIYRLKIGMTLGVWAVWFIASTITMILTSLVLGLVIGIVFVLLKLPAPAI